MKYVVVQRENQEEEIFVFPTKFDHDDFADVLSYLKTGGTNWSREFAKPIAAGFTDGVVCYGRSETLNLDSRGVVDAALFEYIDS